MKKYIICFVFLMLPTIFSFSDDQQLFIQGHDYFVKGDWQQALASYQAISNKSSSVWQNIGSCYFNMQQYAQALLYWKRAYYGCTFLQINELLALEQKALEKLHIDSLGKVYFFCKRILLIIPVIFVQIVFIILLLWVLWILARCWRWQEMTKNDRRSLQKLFFGCFVCSLLWYGHQLFFQKNQAIVVKPNVLVYAGPEQTFHIVKTLPEGNLVCVIQQKQGMYNITSKSVVGWVMQDTLGFISL